MVFIHTRTHTYPYRLVEEENTKLNKKTCYFLFFLTHVQVQICSDRPHINKSYDTHQFLQEKDELSKNLLPAVPSDHIIIQDNHTAGIISKLTSSSTQKLSQL